MDLDDFARYHLILASQSPRRQELLRGLDLRFEVRPSFVDESYPSDLTQEQIPLYIAELKADAQADNLRFNEILISADTVVRLPDRVLGKPTSRTDAFEMLSQLSEKTHLVTTGVCILTPSRRVTFTETTEVTFSYLSDEDINYYLDLYRPYDKAGAYGVQDWIGYVGVERIVGSFYNVMGLPVSRLYKELKLLVM